MVPYLKLVDVCTAGLKRGEVILHVTSVGRTEKWWVWEDSDVYVTRQTKDCSWTSYQHTHTHTPWALWTLWNEKSLWSMKDLRAEQVFVERPLSKWTLSNWRAKFTFFCSTLFDLISCKTFQQPAFQLFNQHAVHGGEDICSQSHIIHSFESIIL